MPKPPKTAVSGTLEAERAHAPRGFPVPLLVRVSLPQPDDREVSDREGEHRAEGVERREELGLARDQGDDRDSGEDEDRDVRRSVLGMDLPEPLRQLAVVAHGEGQPGDADQPGVGGDQQDHGGEDADVVAQDVGEPAAQAQVLHDAENGVAGELGPEVRRVVAADVMDRHRGEGDQRQQRVEAEYGGDRQPDPLRDRLRGVLGLLRHVRDRLDPCVGDHPHRDPEQEVPPARRHAEVDVVDQDAGAENQREPDRNQDHLGAEVGNRQDQVEAGGLLRPLHVERREKDDHRDAADDVARRVPQPRPEHGEVVRHEERRDRDRDDVVEHLPPARKEADQLVEGMSREARRAASFGVHHGGLRVGSRGGHEDQARDDEGDRRQPEGEGGGDAQGVVDRGANVAVGGREERAHAVHARQRFVPGDPSSHDSHAEYTPGTGRPPARDA